MKGNSSLVISLLVWAIVTEPEGAQTTMDQSLDHSAGVKFHSAKISIDSFSAMSMAGRSYEP